MAERSEVAWIILGILVGGLIVYLLTRSKMTTLERDQEGRIVNIIEKVL